MNDTHQTPAGPRVRRATRSPISILVAATVIALAGAGATACGGQTPPPAAAPSAAPAPSAEITPAPIPSPSDAPDIPPDQKDAKFAQALSSKNLQTGSPEDRTQVANRVCQALDVNTSLNDLLPQLQSELGGPTVQDTGFVIGAATAVYCPTNLPKLKSAAGN